MTSAEVIVEFVKGRGGPLEKEVRRICNDAFAAPEVIGGKVYTVVKDAFSVVSDAERASLDRMRGNGAVDWDAVASAFRDDAA